MENSIIAWTDNTFNPAMGCTKVSPGCAHCYAETLTKNRMGLKLWGPQAARQVTTSANWAKPRRWNREAAASGVRLKTFCASLCDVFEDHPTIDGMRPRLWSLIRETPNLDWQLLTKRPERIASNLPDDWGPDGWPHVWLGTSVESEEYAHRIDELRVIPAVVRFVSYEPALGPLADANLSGIDWLICGGESGPGFRPMDVQWVRDVRDRCAEFGAAFFFKQSAAIRTEMGTTLDGEIVRNYPTPRVPRPLKTTRLLFHS